MIYDDKEFLAQMKKDFEKFRETYGFAAYDAILEIFSKQYMKIEELTKSRDSWKDKYRELKLKNDN